MEGILGGYDLILAFIRALLGDKSGKFDQAFIRFSPAITEKHFTRGGKLYEALG
jgi:hypothetical protein